MKLRADYLARREVRERRSLIAERVWWLAVSVAALVVLVCSIVAGAAVTPRTCVLCHGYADAGDAPSAHAAVRCDRCHAGVGAGGLIDQRLRVIGMVARAPFSGDATPAAYVSNRVCLSCHGDVLQRTLTTAGLKMSHREVEAAAWSCVRCHAASGHGAGPDFRGRYTMGMCLGCHSVDPRNAQSCVKCHVAGQERAGREPGSTPWRATHGPDWRTRHGMGELATCKACHPASRCVECHNMPIPHPITFRKLHGKEVIGRQDAEKDCLVCHRAGACESCHGLDMPHPERFLQEHSDVVQAKGSDVCERCHEPSSCLNCHVRHIHPGLSSELLRQLLARPVRP